MVATLAIPWAFAAWFFVPRGRSQTIADEAHFVFVFFSAAAIAAGVLLCSSAMLRVGGRAVAASIPFTIFWALALAAALYEVHEFGEPYRCDVDLCMPSFGLFLVVVPFAFVVTAGVAGSMAFTRSRDADRSRDDAVGDLPRHP